MKKYIIIALLFIVSVLSHARTVKGSVVCGQEKLSGVIVTDGRNFSVTGKHGKFRINISNSAEFVYVLTPSGYTGDWSEGAPKFYHKAKGQKNFVFDLKKTGDPSARYNFIAVGDPQPSKQKHANMFADKPLSDLCETISQLQGPTVGIVLGDVSWDNVLMMDSWKKNITRTGIPFYIVPGNHDYDKELRSDDNIALATYHRHFGPENYAFFMGKDLFIMLDDIIYKPDGKYYEGYSDEIIQWVKSLMKYIQPDIDIYIAQHSPLFGRAHKHKHIHNAENLLGALDGHKVHFMSGHNHISKNFVHSPQVTEHNVASICGTWWMAYHCKDGTPQGYKVYTKADGKLEWYYKSVGKDKDFQYEIFRPGECEVNAESFVVNLWDYDQDWTIEWYEDGNFKGSMARVSEYNPLQKAEVESSFRELNKPVRRFMRTAKSKHYFAAKPSEEAKEITICIKSPFGKTWTETLQIKQ